MRRPFTSRPATLLAEPPRNASRPAALMVPRAGEEGVLRIGMRTTWWNDFYHHALTISWVTFLLAASALYLGLNVVFALLYLLQPDAIAGARPGAFGDAFFFSVQTMATIGYGQLAPKTVYANLLVTVETLLGMLILALATGLMFARFSRPTARVMFSRSAVIAPYNGLPTLSMRLSNERGNQILQADVGLTLVRNERTSEGAFIRRFHDLKLARARTPIFALTFTPMHTVDEASPLWGTTPEALAAAEAELLVTVTGLDETLSQPVHARFSYRAEELLWDRRLVDIFGYAEDGRRMIDFRRFHDTEPV
ncbi:MAG: ion channel [Pseudomonadota bacterium]|nr:ion channel [Pseudomonadota bacterium]